ncbi:ArsR/SmtB family transcription factor [Marihabitans asiaticum]|uniref:ArsR family transcriptional regulator n=1 Tax=Marihabitans asiaticum TaxID=415218 RepID=A0A560WH75_9MICO|nr:helix-turn-helix domain-containing protein [Marihabitans asiaticum]TWD16928.1 ArsR family transcriptional regulator [Marihabitans asiaticum]
MARRRTELRISDLRTLRALAHPARQRLITELFSGEVLTATEAAGIVGLTPSATSYHLRALEKAGIVVRSEAAGDARERPWRAAAESISVVPEGHRAAGPELSEEYLLGLVADLQEGLTRQARAIAAGEDEVGTASRGRRWLTDAEARELRERLREIYDEYAGRNRSDHPQGARPWDIHLFMLPARELPGP